MSNPREIAEQLRWRMELVEPERAEQIAEDETEMIEFRAELKSDPDKWSVGNE